METSHLCVEENGTPEHLFFDCPYARDAWSTTGLLHFVMGRRKPRGSMWFRELLREHDDAICELVIMICDRIWFQRNRQLFDQAHTRARDMAASVVVCLDSFAAAQDWQRPSVSLLPQTLLRPPDTGFRVYFDAGIRDGSAGTGVVVFDPQNNFYRAISRRIPGILDPQLAELLALEEAMILANDLRLGDVCFIGDSLQVIQIVRGDIACPVDLFSIVNRIKAQLDFSPSSGPFWIPRDHNFVADSLTNFAKTSPLLFNAWVSPPSILSFASGRFPVS